MKLLIVGASESSKKIASTLLFENVFVQIVDVNEESLKNFEELNNVNKVKIDSYDIKNILSLGLENFDTMLAFTEYDEFNIILASLGKEQGINTVLAKTNNSVTYGNLHLLKEKLNIDFFMNEEIEIAKTIKKVIKESKISQIDSFAEGKIETFIYLVENDKQFLDMQIKDIKGIEGMVIAAVIRSGEIIIPNGSTVIKRDDRLYFMGLSKSISLFDKTHYKYIEKEEQKKIMFLGSTPLIEETVCRLNPKDWSIKVLSRDKSWIKDNKDKMQDSLISYGDYRKSKVLEWEDVITQDFIVISTNEDEEAIVTALLLKSMGVEKIIINLNNPEYTRIFDGLGIHAVINKSSVVANRIIKKIRKNRDISVYIMFNGMVEVVEITLSEKSKAINTEIKNLGLSQGVVIGGIIKPDGRALIPQGDTYLEIGDRLVVFCLNERRDELNKFLDVEKSRSFFSELINLY